MSFERETSSRTAREILRSFLPVALLLAGTLAFALVAFAWLGIVSTPASWQGLLIANAIAMGVVAIACWHGKPAVVLAALSFAVFFAMPGPLAYFSYAAVGLGAGVPLVDAHLARIDAAFGFDWLAVVGWFNQFPWMVKGLEWAYHGTIFPVMYVLILLNLLGREERIIEFLLLFIATCAICAGLSGFIPAIGAYVHFQPGEAVRGAIPLDAGVWHLEHFNQLRSGQFREFTVTATQGLVTFPSFHTAAALSIPLALRGLGAMAGLGWTVAAIILVSTIPVGGHYVVDVVAGAAIAFLTHAAIIAWMGRRRHADVTSAVPAVA